jgi:hypothetical protein
MQKGGSKILTGVKYVYLIFFFALLSGLFYPIIESGANANGVIMGMIILFIGLSGALCVYKAGTTDKRQKTYLITGFAILAMSLLLVFAAAGRL